MKIYVIDSIRVGNFKEETLDKIVGLWENCNNQYPELQDLVRYGIYSDYEKDYRGDYNLAVGSTDIETKDSINIDLNDYKIYKAKTNGEIYSLWEEIWDDEENGKIDRLYNVDFERYNLDGTVDIFIGIK